MTATKHSNTPSFQDPLLPDLHHPPQQYVVVLPHYPHPDRHRLLRKSCRRSLYCVAASLLFIIAAGYLLWPSEPEISVVRLSLDRLHVHKRPKISLDVTLDLTVRIRNEDFYSIDYDSLLVSIDYRGRSLGFVTSGGGHIKPRASSYVNATLQLDGQEVISDVILLLEDLAKGAITFDTVSGIRGKLGMFFIDLPLKTKISCEVIVNTNSQTISHQSCYPEVSEVVS